MYKKKFKNDQDVCWLEEDYMEKKKIVRDQSKNYFHLTPKIGSQWGVGLSKIFQLIFWGQGGGRSADALKVICA